MGTKVRLFDGNSKLSQYYLLFISYKIVFTARWNLRSSTLNGGSTSLNGGSTSLNGHSTSMNEDFILL